MRVTRLTHHSRERSHVDTRRHITASVRAKRTIESHPVGHRRRGHRLNLDSSSSCSNGNLRLECKSVYNSCSQRRTRSTWLTCCACWSSRTSFSLRTRRTHRANRPDDALTLRALRTHRASRSSFTLQSPRTNRTRQSSLTSRTLKARKTLRACHTLRTHRTDFSLRTSRASRTLRTHRPNLTLRTHRTDFSLRTGRASRTLRTHRPNLTLRTHRTDFSLRTDRASQALRTHQPNLTPRTDRADFPLRADRASQALRTHRANQSDLALDSLRTDELGIVRSVDPHLALAALILAQHETPISSGLVRLAQHIGRRQVSSER